MASANAVNRASSARRPAGSGPVSAQRSQPHPGKIEDLRLNLAPRRVTMPMPCAGAVSAGDAQRGGVELRVGRGSTVRRRSCPGGSRAENAQVSLAPTGRCDPQLEFFQEGLQGMRNYMEDRTLAVQQVAGAEGVSLFGVFDGHGGFEVAQIATEMLPSILASALSKFKDPTIALRESFIQLDQQIRDIQHVSGQDFEKTGCTACVVLSVRRAGRLRLLCANAGDSRAVLCRGGVHVELSQDHKPQNPGERRRIEAAGGQVILYDTTGRIDGSLAVSRALGDFRYKARSDLQHDRQKVIAVPDIKEMLVGKCDEFVAVVSDGVTAVFSDEELVNMIGASRRRGSSWERAIKDVLEQAIPGGDNCSMCLATFVN